MADLQQLSLLKQGQSVWNEWREEHPNILLNLRDVDLYRVNLSKMILRGADLRGADLRGADLREADLREADLREADLRLVNLRGACLKGADLKGAFLQDVLLQEADLSFADLSETNLSFADFYGANLTRANLVRSNLMNATLANCNIYGVSAWDLILDGAKQSNLIITSSEQPTVTVDNIEVAQFIYLLLNNEKVRNVFDTLTSKIVLILGHFPATRKTALSILRNKLRQYDYLPVLFNFEKANNKGLTEMFRSLANMSRFIIADITDPGSIPQELQAIVSRRAVPILPIREGASDEHVNFHDFIRYPWVLEIYSYKDFNVLLSSFSENVIRPLESKLHKIEDLKDMKSYDYIMN